MNLYSTTRLRIVESLVRDAEQYERRAKHHPDYPAHAASLRRLAEQIDMLHPDQKDPTS